MKRGEHPTTSRRAKIQKDKDKYAHAREDLQLAGVLPTEPAEALRDERVSPQSQGEQRIPSLDRQAITAGWAVPEEKKQLVVKRLLEPFEEEPVEIKDDKGNVIGVQKPSPKLLNQNARVLIHADQRQYERDHPEEAGKAKGGGNQVNVFSWAGVLKEVQDKQPHQQIEDAVERPLIGLRELGVPSGKQEVETAPEEDQQENEVKPGNRQVSDQK